jgi:hypothetical protein
VVTFCRAILGNAWLLYPTKLLRWRLTVMAENSLLPGLRPILDNYEVVFFVMMPTMTGPQRVRRTLATA